MSFPKCLFILVLLALPSIVMAQACGGSKYVFDLSVIDDEVAVDSIWYEVYKFQSEDAMREYAEDGNYMEGVIIGEDSIMPYLEIVEKKQIKFVTSIVAGVEMKKSQIFFLTFELAKQPYILKLVSGNQGKCLMTNLYGGCYKHCEVTIAKNEICFVGID